MDRFGNCITSLTRDDLPGEGGARTFRLVVNGREIRAVRRYYAEEEGARPGEPFAIWGSAGFLEIAANRESAAARLGAAPGDPVAAYPG